MKKSLLFSLLIVVLASLFASKAPDGLDKTSELLGFATKSIENKSFMTDYSISFIKLDSVSTALAGIAGVILIVLIFVTISKFKKVQRHTGPS